MKKISKVLSVIVVMTMIVSTMAFAATFSDVPDSANCYEAVSVLSALGIINGYEDGTFGPDRDVTRAEFSAMLMRALASGGLGSSDPAGTPFTDLGDAEWAISDIRTAYDLGIINGMTLTTFEPNSNVTYEQALKMIVCALNYGPHAEQIQSAAPAQPWYYGYMQTAITLGLTSGVPYVIEQPAKRQEIAQMIYNAFDVKMLEKVEVTGGGVMYQETNNTLLGNKLNVTKSRGEIYADETNTMAPDGSTARAGYVLIYDNVDKKTYTIAKNGISVSGMLGKNVDYYYKTDSLGEKVLVFVLVKGSSNSLTVKADDINRVTGSYAQGYTVEYYPSATATNYTTIKIPANPIISINGEVYTNVAASDLMIESGSIEFIMTDGEYSKINVEAYETYVVKSVNSTDKYIVDMLRTSGSNTLYLDDQDSNYAITIKNSSGSMVSVSGLSQYNVLSVRKGKGTSNRTTIDVTVSSKNVTGVIKEINRTDRVINVNGTEYGISSYLLKYGSSTLDSLSTNDNGKFYLDSDGKIAYAVKTASTTTYYGYIAGASKDSDVVKIGLVSSKVSSVGSPYLTVANKVKIDGETYSKADDVLNALKAGASVATANIDGNGNLYSQLVKYTLNSSGEISAIETAYLGDSENADDDTLFRAFEVSRNDNKMTYKSSSSDFIGSSNSQKFRINSSTQVFVVPLDRSEYDSYGRKTSSFFKDGGSYIVEAYDVTGSLNVAGAVVVYETEETQETVDYDTPLFLITGLSQTINKDGDDCDRVTGYQITSSGSVSEITVDTARTNVIYGNYSIGDIIMYVTDNKGYLKEASIVDVISPSAFAAKNTHVGTHKYNSSLYTCELYSGLLLGSDIDGTIQMFDLAVTDSVSECEYADAVSFTTTSSTKYFTYDSSLSDSSKVTRQEGTLDLASFASYNDTIDTDSPAAAKVFVYRYSGNPKLVYVIK